MVPMALSLCDMLLLGHHSMTCRYGIGKGTNMPAVATLP